MKTEPQAVFVVGAGCISPAGSAWRGLAQLLRDSPPRPRPVAQLATSHPIAPAFEITDLPEAREPAEKRARMQMSRAAILASIATHNALADAGFSSPLTDVGLFMGVGASGGSLEQLVAMLRVSIEGGHFSLERFGREGLAACNPLYAFQLMNNFTLAHAAILHGMSGPNAAFYSRGAGTITALNEALHALRDGDCPRALAGAADSALHPVTFAELQREGHIDVAAGEGAAMFALSTTAEKAVARVDLCSLYPAKWLDDRLRNEIAVFSPDSVVLAQASRSGREPLVEYVTQSCSSASLMDVTTSLGESLAATPALALALALDLVTSHRRPRVLVLGAGLDGDRYVVGLSRASSP